MSEPMTISYTVTGFDAELDAISVCIRAVQFLDVAGRTRCLAYLASRYPADAQSWPLYKDGP